MKTTPINLRHGHGFTLVEMVTSLAVMSVLMLGLSSAVLIGSFAIPNSTTTGKADQNAVDVLNQLRQDLRLAQQVRHRTSGSDHQLLLTMQSISAEGMPSSIQYNYVSSSQILTRKVDTNPTVVVLSNVSTYSMAVTQSNSKIQVFRVLCMVDDTIQRIFQATIELPNNPEAN
ncbi:MAG: PulJ/GspJ family protein [Phycisphaerales bacterium]